MKRLLITTLLLLITSSAFGQGDVLRIATYNILNFPDDYTERIPEFQKVIRALNPDVLVVQEMQSEAGTDLFLSDVLNVLAPGGWAAAPFFDEANSDNALFYRIDAVDFISIRQIPTWDFGGTRDIDEYVLRPLNNLTISLYIYSVHLKAGDGSSNEQRRLVEATILRENLDSLSAGSYFLVVGDFNIQTSDEEAYQVLTREPSNIGRCYDPIESPGHWNNNLDFAAIHTQATHAEWGGMDDRYDQMLSSSTVLNTTGFEYLEDSYNAFGNDGYHFNRSINAGDNTAVPDSIADALFNASDHIPVSLDLYFRTSAGPTSERPNLAAHYQLYSYPNPFNPTTTIRYDVKKTGKIRLAIYDLLGREVVRLIDDNKLAGSYRISWDATSFPSGIYLCRMEAEGFVQTRKLVLMK